MSIASELTRLINAKAAIRSAIQAQGVTVAAGLSLDGYAARIALIEGSGPVVTAPEAFTVGQWTATAGDGSIALNITALPADGGAAITTLQYTLDGGTWVSLVGTGTGPRTITAGVVNDTTYPIQLRAINGTGTGPASDVKSRTPAAVGGSGTVTWVSFQETAGSTGGAGIAAVKPTGTVATDLLIAEVSPTSVPSATLSTPAGWTYVGGAHAAHYGGQGTDIFVAPGDVVSTTFLSATGSSIAKVVIHRVSGANLTSPVRAFATLDTDDTGVFNTEDDNMPTPSVTANSGDLVLSFYQNCQGGTVTGTVTSGYTRRYSSTDPVRISTIARTLTATGATGLILHGDAGGYMARTGATLAVASA